jgi:hypothetical protein
MGYSLCSASEATALSCFAVLLHLGSTVTIQADLEANLSADPVPNVAPYRCRRDAANERYLLLLRFPAPDIDEQCV